MAEAKLDESKISSLDICKKIILLDLDDTLIDPYKTPIPFKEVIECLDILLLEGHLLVLFTHNSNGVELAKAAGIFHYFDFVAAGCYAQFNKQWNLDKVMEKYPTILISNMILFDDTYDIIQWFQKIGGVACHVNFKRGLRIENLLSIKLLKCDEVFGFGLSPYV